LDNSVLWPALVRVGWYRYFINLVYHLAVLVCAAQLFPSITDTYVSGVLLGLVAMATAIVVGVGAVASIDRYKLWHAAREANKLAAKVTHYFETLGKDR
jgi:hypothetical protein